MNPLKGLAFLSAILGWLAGVAFRLVLDALNWIIEPFWRIAQGAAEAKGSLADEQRFMDLWERRIETVIVATLSASEKNLSDRAHASVLRCSMRLWPVVGNALGVYYVLKTALGGSRVREDS